MADISVTAASVAKTSATATASGIAGETITAGQPVYLSSADSRLYKADANDTAAKSVVVGIALHASLAGQPLTYATPAASGSTYTAGATLVVGEIYVLSTTLGAIAPCADLATLSFTTIIGYATSASVMYLLCASSGVAHG